MRNIFIIILVAISCNSLAQTPIPGGLGGIIKASATVVYMTWDGTNKGSNTTISGGNLIATNSSGTGSACIGNVFHSTGSGLYYCEITQTHTGLATDIGLMKSGYTSTDLNATFVGTSVKAWGLFNYGVGTTYNNNIPITTPVTGGTAQTTGTTYCMAFDGVNGKVYAGYISAGINQWFNGSGTTSTFASAISIFSTLSGSFTIAAGYVNDVYTLNSGQSAYAGAAPSGYTIW